MKTGLLALALVVPLAGCGAGPGASCTVTPYLGLSPSTATASSTAKSPGNQQQFQAVFAANYAGSDCEVPALEQLAHPVWTNPDTVHITISSANDETNGTAVCKGATGGPVTLSATATQATGQKPVTGTVTLTCN